MDFPQPCLCLVTDRSQCEGRLLEDVVDQSVSGGVNMVQLREKDLTTAQLYSLAVRLRDVIDGRALLIVNDRLDVAIASGANGIQLGEEGLPIEAARRVSSGNLYLGRSVHSVDGAGKAEADGADFLIVGTIFPTGSHPGQEAAGVGLLQEIGEHVQLPYLGIGGINESNISSVMDSGVSGVALITGLTKSPDPKESAMRLTRFMTDSLIPHRKERLIRKV